MIFVVAPEPAAWIAPVLEAARAAGPVTLFAPWALPEELVRLAPGALASPLRRRSVTGAEVRNVPGWLALELALRTWARSHTDRQMESRFVLRRATDALAAHWIPDGCTTVIAPSLAARRTFAAASTRGLRTFLVEDLPHMRRMHDDLDLAAERHPQAAFLRRFRANARVLARQDAERVLASHVLVRSHFARAQLVAAGRDSQSILELPMPQYEGRPVPRLRAASGPRRVLLAGFASARHGTFEALEAIRSRSIELLVRVGEGTEPRDLLHHGQVRAATKDELHALAGVDAVLAPSWCEAHAPEVAHAAAIGVPVIATARAAGFVDLASRGVEVQPGDVAGIVAALHHTRALLPPAPPPPDRTALLAEALAGRTSEAKTTRLPIVMGA